MILRDDARRLGDIETAVSAIARHLMRGAIEDELVFDGCRVRLIEIGEAVKGISPEPLARAPDVPWREIARMRDHLTHRYFDTQHEIVADVIATDLAALTGAVAALRQHLAEAEGGQAALDLKTDPEAQPLAT